MVKMLFINQNQTNKNVDDRPNNWFVRHSCIVLWVQPNITPPRLLLGKFLAVICLEVLGCGCGADADVLSNTVCVFLPAPILIRENILNKHS